MGSMKQCLILPVVAVVSVSCSRSSVLPETTVSHTQTADIPPEKKQGEWKIHTIEDQMDHRISEVIASVEANETLSGSTPELEIHCNPDEKSNKIQRGQVFLDAKVPLHYSIWNDQSRMRYKFDDGETKPGDIYLSKLYHHQWGSLGFYVTLERLLGAGKLTLEVQPFDGTTRALLTFDLRGAKQACVELAKYCAAGNVDAFVKVSSHWDTQNWDKQ